MSLWDGVLVDAINAKLLASLAQTTTFNPIITVGKTNETQIVPAASGAVVCRLALSGHVDSGFLRIVVPKGNATSFLLPADLQLLGDIFVPTMDYVLEIECDSTGLATPLFLARGQAIPDRDRGAPTVVVATISADIPDRLNVTFNEAVYMASLAGQSLNFSVGTPRTITSIISGNGTTTFVFQLSAAVAGSDVISYAYSSSNTVTDMSSNPLAAGSASVTNNASSFTGVVSRHRLDAATLSGSNVTAIADSSGNGNTLSFASGKQPIITSSNGAINAKPSAKWDGVDDVGQCSAVKVGGSDPADYTAITIAMIVKFNAATSGFQVHLTDATGARFIGHDLYTDSPTTLYWAVGGAPNQATKASPTVNAFISLIVTLHSSNGTTEIFINGSSVATNVNTHNPVAIRKMSLGASYDLLASYFSQMDLAEVLIADHEWSSGERSTWQTYITSRYGM